MNEKSCETCASRSEFSTVPPSKRAPAYDLAECLHRPLPPFWNSTPLMVGRDCGAECKSYKRIDAQGEKP